MTYFVTEEFIPCKSIFQQNASGKRKESGRQTSEILEELQEKTMQTLTAGSFLNLENASTVEALKFTARRLAEHTANVVKENLQPAPLENLARQLWEKAEYVARETERRRLHQIFVENFSERFRELKPETVEAQKSELTVSPVEATIKNAESDEQSHAPLTNESGDAESAAASENVSLSVSPEESAAVVEGKRDEFLGFVESGEPFGDAQATDANVMTVTAPTIAQADDKLAAESSKPNNQSSVEIPNPANQPADTADESASPTPENLVAAKTEATVSASAESKPAATTTAATTSAGKNGVSAVVADGREPFEFEKCTINLNLTLLPAEPGKNARKVIVGATSHNLPPEIDFLEITEGGDLTQIAELVRAKLARFRQTLPVKYIEQLRASKAKSAKKVAPTKVTTAATAAPTQPATNQSNRTKESGEQKAAETKRAETGKPQPEAATKKNAAVSIAPMLTANQSGAGNNIQGSLF